MLLMSYLELNTLQPYIVCIFPSLGLYINHHLLSQEVSLQWLKDVPINGYKEKKLVYSLILWSSI